MLYCRVHQLSECIHEIERSLNFNLYNTDYLWRQWILGAGYRADQLVFPQSIQQHPELFGRDILRSPRNKSFYAQPSETMLAWGRTQGLQPPPYPIAGIRVPVRRNRQCGNTHRSSLTDAHIGDYVNGHLYRKPHDSKPDDFMVFVPVRAFFTEGCHRWNEHSLHHCEEPGLRRGINEHPILDLPASELVERSKATRAAVEIAREARLQEWWKAHAVDGWGRDFYSRTAGRSV